MELHSKAEVIYSPASLGYTHLHSCYNEVYAASVWPHIFCVRILSHKSDQSTNSHFMSAKLYDLHHKWSYWRNMCVEYLVYYVLSGSNAFNLCWEKSKSSL